MEWAATAGKVPARERRQRLILKRAEQVADRATAVMATARTPETSTLVSIYRCDSELRISEVIYSDHVGDPTQFMGGTDYDWLPRDEAEVVMGLKQRAVTEQRPARDTVLLTLEGSPRTFRIAVYPEKDRSPEHVITVVVTEI